MRIKLTQQKLKFITLAVFTVLGLLIICTSIAVNSSLHNVSNNKTNIFAQNPIFQDIYQEPTEKASIVTNSLTNANGATVLGVDNCSALRLPIEKGGDPARGLHPDCANSGASLPFKAPISGGRKGEDLGYGGGEIEITYKVCIHDLCVPKETLASTFNCANTTCPFIVDGNNVYLKKPDSGRTLNFLANEMSVPLESSFEKIDTAIQRQDHITSTTNHIKATGQLVETDKFFAKYNPIEANFVGEMNAIEKEAGYDSGKDLSTLSTGDLASELLDANTAPGLYIDGRNYEKIANCTQYKPANNTVLDTTKKSSKCYIMHITQPTCETRTVIVSKDTISKCVDEALNNYNKQLDEYNPNDPTSSEPAPPSSADCKKAIDFQVNTTGLYGNSFNTSGAVGGTSQRFFDQSRTQFYTPNQIEEIKDQSVNFDTVTENDNPLSGVMWLTNATVDVTVLSVAGIGTNIVIPLIKTTALWPDSSFDWHYESQAATSIPNDQNIIDKTSYNDAIGKFYADRNYGACSI